MINESTNELEKIKTSSQDKQAFLLIIALILGIFVRVLLLDQARFTESELILSHNALLAARGIAQETSTAPAYTGVTTLLFFLFGSGDFLARIWPALFGVSMIVIPWFWKDLMGKKASLILSFLLALNPVFVTFSRAINPGVFAIGGILWVLTFLKLKKPYLSAVFLAIAFLSGAAFWNTLLIPGIAYLLARLFLEEKALEALKTHFDLKTLLRFDLILVFLVTVFLFSTSFLLEPQGLGGAGSSFVGFFRQFTQGFEKPFYHPIYLLLAHNLLFIVLYFLQLIRKVAALDEKQVGFFGLLTIISLIYAMLVSRSSFEMLMLPVLFLLIVAADALAEMRLAKEEFNFLNLTISVFTLALLGFIAMNLRRLAVLNFGTPQFTSIALIILAGLILLASSWWLAKFALPDKNVGKVMLISLLFLLAVLNLSSLYRGIGVDQPYRANEFLGKSVFMPNDTFSEVFDEFNLTGRNLAQLGSYQLVDLPEHLGWYFREFSIFSPQSDATLIMSRSSDMPGTDVDYRGMNIVLERSVDWKTGGIIGYLKGLTGGKMNYIDQKAVLWIKTSLFTGANQ